MVAPIIDVGKAGLLLPLVSCLLLTLGPSLAETAGQSDSTVEQGEVVTVNLGQSRVIRAPWPVKRVSVTEPKVADVRTLSADRVLLLGKSVGSTDLVMWNEDEEYWQATVRVRVDRTRLRDELMGLLPGSDLDIQQSEDVVVVRGKLARAEQAQMLRNYFASAELTYVDMTSLAGVQQVQIQVRVAEVSRTAIRSLGVNLFGTGSDFFGGVTVGPDGGGAFNPISIGAPAGAPANVSSVPFSVLNDTAVGSSVTLFGGFPSAGLEFFLQALAENQYLRLLAEPKLVALSGEEASFLVGGEFPIPVVQGGLAGSTSISVEYKEFGVRLRFRPVVLGDGTIRLFVAPEVSSLTDFGAVNLAGFSIPAITTRRAQTTVELKSGQTFGMAGLIQRTDDGRSSRVPGLGDVPVLGALFRSVRYVKGETELVVLVTASLVEPVSLAGPGPVPGELHEEPDCWDLYCMAQIESSKPAQLSPEQAAWLEESGLNRLKGPGAWINPTRAYEAPTPRYDGVEPMPPDAAPAAQKLEP